VDKFALTSGGYLFSLILKDPDYGIPTKNLWILVSNPELHFVVESRKCNLNGHLG
jgi:hypothetical protein